MSGSGRWADLAPRIGSAIVMVTIGILAVWAGADVFHIFVAAVCGAMIWELLRMLNGQSGPLVIAIACTAALSLILAIHLPSVYGLPVLAVPVLLGVVTLRQHRLVCGAFMGLVLLAGLEMAIVRDDFGLVWIIWLIVIVIVSDVAGYFAGRTLGGPKFWPKVSPKKTWSGTVAGWLGAAVVGLVFAMLQDTSLLLVPYSVLVAFAAQMGDIAESAVKRMVGVKDSSTLIPGHGGFLDRFDGMLGASFFVLVIAGLCGLPPGAV
ncbi:phosphatidate cytidylyltransferase [Sedimentitalea todarodis]|uniref:Phosphatidate cytidylyltransferase n=1 Tax=Sedimentitalea todarodis TaxID=1631240 RepID=A0ABU3VBF7_9RHOB|nr:phosphatidate cytidylyltransferase [Sedimentitalea todarodis]MDU9003355.1 phosphatidate cytidylyltransferase [Sedimentitalea todarodis]